MVDGFLVIVFIVYLISSFSKTGKKKKSGTPQRKRSPMRGRVQGEQADWQAIERDRQTQEGFAGAFETKDLHEETDSCKTDRMHPHEVSQLQFETAAEGEDPCHVGSAGYDDIGFDESDKTRQQLAQDVLRGVIMSEILARPQERYAQAAMMRNRRDDGGQ